MLAAHFRATRDRIVQAFGKDPSLAEECRRLLLPLLREDDERGNNLVATLRTYYACGMRVDKTAERLFLHRNSVRYRLSRIRSLLHADIDHPDSIAAYMLALALPKNIVGKEENRDAV